MPRSANLFHNLVTDENSTTELLCNLMRFAAFRRPLLVRLLSDAHAGRISWEDIDTQIELRECGRPDLCIENDELLALVEVKVERDQGLTENQPDGYFAFLAKDNRPERWLVFLVPKRWEHLKNVEVALQRLRFSHPAANVQTKFVYWEDILAVIDENDLSSLSPLLNEFHRLLSARVKPESVVFSTREVVMLFSDDVPTTLSNLERLISGIQERSSMYKSYLSRSRALCPEEYGLYFKDVQDKDALWFGVWMPFWKEEGIPLCFGVADAWPSAIQETFRASYIGPTKHFQRYTLGWIPQQALASKNAVEEVWKQLAPVLQAVVGTDTTGWREAKAAKSS